LRQQTHRLHRGHGLCPVVIAYASAPVLLACSSLINCSLAPTSWGSPSCRSTRRGRSPSPSRWGRTSYRSRRPGHSSPHWPWWPTRGCSSGHRPRTPHWALHRPRPTRPWPPRPTRATRPTSQDSLSLLWGERRHNTLESRHDHFKCRCKNRVCSRPTRSARSRRARGPRRRSRRSYSARWHHYHDLIPSLFLFLLGHLFACLFRITLGSGSPCRRVREFLALNSWHG